MNLYSRKGMPLCVWTSILKRKLACVPPCTQKNCATICSNMFCLLLSLIWYQPWLGTWPCTCYWFGIPNLPASCWPCLFFLEPELRSCISSAHLPAALLTACLLKILSADPVFNYCICCFYQGPSPVRFTCQLCDSVLSARSQKNLNELEGEQRWALKLLEA